MLTVQDLLSGAPPLLRALNSPVGQGVPVQDVVVCADPWTVRGPLQGVLVIASVRCHRTDEGATAGPAELWGRPEQWMPDLVQGGAAGLVVIAERGLGVPWRTLLAGAGGLPVLEPYEECSAVELESLVLSRRREAVRLVRRRTGELLDLSSRLHRRGEGPGPLLRWLERQTGATVTVLDDLEDGWLELPVHNRLLDLVAQPSGRPGEDGEASEGHSDGAAGDGRTEDARTGETGAGAVCTPGPCADGGRFDPEPDEQYVMLHELGGEARHPVLAAARSTPLPRAEQELLAKAADQITLLRMAPGPRGRHRRPHPHDAARPVAHTDAAPGAADGA